MIATQKHQQLILLEPGKAELLERLAKKVKGTKQSLLRLAVDNLLAMGALAPSQPIDDMRDSLRECRRLVQGMGKDRSEDAPVARACGQVELLLTVVLGQLGERKR